MGGGLGATSLCAKEIIMKVSIILFTFILLILLSSCSKEIVSLSEYEKVILENSFYKSIPFLQSKSESEILKKNQVKSLSLVIYRKESKPDSVTFIEYDTEGRMIYKTTIEESGCYSPYWVKQEFFYENNRIKKVNYYNFKYTTNSILEKWVLKDTLQLLLIDRADYSYNDDTTIVEIGWGTLKFIRDENDNIIKQVNHMKTNNQLFNIDFDYSGSGIDVQMMDNMAYSKPTNLVYEIRGNSIFRKTQAGEKANVEEYVYDSNGLPITRTYYVNADTTSRAVISYSYY